MDNDNIFDSLSGATPDPQERVRLKVLGLSYSQISNGAYALILSEIDGPIRIPVVIGAGEAQAIAIRMEGIVTPRPMTHELFTSLGRAFGIELQEVFIYRFEDGVFYSELTFSNGERTVTIDSRTSDAVAIAMRTGAPIYTTRAILEETGFEMEITSPAETSDSDEESGELTVDDKDAAETPRAPRLENYSLEELRRTLDRLIDNEEYEEASKVSEIIRRKEQARDNSDNSDNSDGADMSDGADEKKI
ncbi:MAG: bifunctional nuclease family protein [Duncaniella sp.]|nr:bifunctional nuclease family protein [Duncaniella sp.]